jgi:hypothetical protein
LNSGPIPNTKMAGGVVQGVGPEFKPQNCQKKKRHLWKEH